jgi:hypothetical protein
MLAQVGTTEGESRWNIYQHRVTMTITQLFGLCNQQGHSPAKRLADR